MQQVTITEQCGAKWIAETTNQQGERAVWVQISISGGPSAAKPGIVGFYAPSIAAACDALNN